MKEIFEKIRAIAKELEEKGGDNNESGAAVLYAVTIALGIEKANVLLELIEPALDLFTPAVMELADEVKAMEKIVKMAEPESAQNWIQKNFHKFIPVVARYQSGGAIAVYYDIPLEECPNFNETACYATINVPGTELKPNEVIIKDYSENEGLYDCMVKAGHIKPMTRTVQTGFVEGKICELLLPLPK